MGKVGALGQPFNLENSSEPYLDALGSKGGKETISCTGTGWYVSG